MKLISWNINGIRAFSKKNILPEFLKIHNPDILCFQETKAHIEQLTDDIININGYKSYFSSGLRKGYSGVAVYTKEEPISVKTGFGLNPIFDQEGRILIIEYSQFILFNIYFPNGASRKDRLDFKMDFYQELLKYLDNIQHKNKSIIITGDINTAHTEIDLARPKENKNTSGFLEIERVWIDKLINEYQFIDTFRKFNSEPNWYTWWDTKTKARERNVGWRIDYFFVNKPLQDNLKNAKILSEVFGSDHCPILLELEFKFK